MAADQRVTRRSAYDPRTGILMVSRDHNAAHGSLEDMERFARDILRAVAQQRLAQYTAEARPFLDTLHDI